MKKNINTPVNDLPLADNNTAGKLLSDSDKELEVDKEIDSDEVVNILDDAKESIREVAEAMNAPEVNIEANDDEEAKDYDEETDDKEEKDDDEDSVDHRKLSDRK